MQYEEYGEEFVDMLDGMFSFVLLDTHDKSFIAARDAIGICPLYMGWGLDGMHCLAVHLLPKILSLNYLIIFSCICMLFWNCFAFLVVLLFMLSISALKPASHSRVIPASPQAMTNCLLFLFLVYRALQFPNLLHRRNKLESLYLHACIQKKGVVRRI
jgi:hypothetical protein